MNLNIRLNIKSIIKAEQFLNKPFSAFDYTNEKELKALLYCIVLMNNPETFTFSEFESLLEAKKISSDIFRQFEKQSQVMAQFISGSKANEEDAAKEAGDPAYIKDLVSLLIIEGMNPYYVMNELQLSDLSLYVEAYKKNKEAGMEEKRLWTFLTCAPHLDLKKVKTAVDFYPLPWEVDRLEKERQEYIAMNERNLERFLNEGMNFIKPDHIK